MKRHFLFFFLFISFTHLSSQNKTEVYINNYKTIAITEMNQFGIPASITLAQGILESGNGESRLAVEANNHFGIKCHDNWNGKTIIKDDDEKGECFRKYNKVADSYRDHSLFLTERERYAFLFSLCTTNYKSWAKGLKKAGYATNPKYATLLIDLIDKYDLNRFDEESAQQKQLYFAHTYGFPYLTGIVAFYIQNKSLYFAEANTSFVFSSASLGFNYVLFNNIYAGANFGIIYLPSKETDIVPNISAELMYRRNNQLIRAGIQYPLVDMEYQMIPYFRLTYLIN